MNHSKLPWRVTDATEKKTREIVDANGATVAKLTALDMANAELIVSAVNAARVPVAWRYKAVRIVDGVRVPIKQIYPEGHEWEITQNPPYDWSHLSYPLNSPVISDYEALCVMPAEDKPC